MNKLFWPALKADTLALLALLRQPKVALSRARGILALFKMLFMGETIQVLPSLYQKRMEVCRQCPIFNSKRQTCGTAFGETWIDPETKKVEPLGCLCWMPLKSKLKVNCYLYDRTNGELGWTRELNSFPDLADTPGNHPANPASGQS